MAKRVAAATARRKARELERVVRQSGAKSRPTAEAIAWVAANANEIAQLPTDSSGEGSLGRDPQAQREANRQKEANRAAVNKLSGKQRRIAGFEVAAGGYVVEKSPRPERAIEWVEPTAEDARMHERLQQLLDAASPFDPDFDEVGAERSYSSVALEKKMRARRGMVPTGILDKVRKAYASVFALAPADEWQQQLYGRAAYVLRYSLAGNKPPNGPRTGREILDALKRTLGEERVPRTLTAERISLLLKRSTLAARGGGRGGKKSLRAALDELIVEMKQTQR